MSILDGIEGAPDIRSMVDNIAMPRIDGSALDFGLPSRDIFAPTGRSGWHTQQHAEARCDFSQKIDLTRRSGVMFATIWRKTVVGRTLAEIKQDPSMPDFFAASMIPLIAEMIGHSLNSGSWAVCTTPCRRHLEGNFAEKAAAAVASGLSVPFYRRAATARTRQRINPDFVPANIPAEPNVILYDDIVTTGSTLRAMRDLLWSRGKNVIAFSNINNKL